MTLVGLLVLHAAFGLAGAAILLALGLLRPTPAEVAIAAGPACLVGMLATMLLGILLLVAGLEVTLPIVLVAAVAIAAAAAGVHRLRRPAVAEPPAERRRGERLLAAVAAGALGLFFVLAAPAFTNLPTAWDDAHIWSFKAVALYEFGGLERGVFLNPEQAISHLDYPVLQPLLEATVFRAMGRDDVGLFHVELWVVFGLAVWTAGWLMRCHPPALWLPALGVLALLPQLRGNVTIGYADATSALFLGLGALAAGLWLERGATGRLLLAGLFLAAAANTKNEGLAGALVLLVAVAVAAVLRRERRGLAPLAATGALSLAAVAPWRAWTAAHDLGSDATTPLGTVLSSGFLSGRIDRLEYATNEMIRKLGDGGQWLLTPALFVALAVAALFTPARRIALYYLGAAVGLLLVLAWIYWTSPQPLGFHVDTTVDRTVSGAAVIGVMGTMHLCALLGAGLLRAPAVRETRGGPAS